MKNKNSILNHNLYTDSGECCACSFLRTAIKMMAEEYRAEYQAMLDVATAIHSSEAVELWPPINKEMIPWH